MEAARDRTIAIVVLTYERVHLLRECLEKVVARASERCTEVVVWNNGQDSATREYLASIACPRLRVVSSERNLGHNAYDRAIALTTAPLVIELDDDVVEAPQDWDATLADAYDALPSIGYLAANLEHDPNDAAARTVYGRKRHLYRNANVNGHELKLGPVGGFCTITDRALYERVGGFGQDPKWVFWSEDARYVYAIEDVGFEAATLASLRVHHAGGEHYSTPAREKLAWWAAYHRRERRRDRVKRLLLLVPGVSAANRRLGLFVPP